MKKNKAPSIWIKQTFSIRADRITTKKSSPVLDWTILKKNLIMELKKRAISSNIMYKLKIKWATDWRR
jgi:transposase